jgi:ribonucleoside-diphosphate reductase beta chain
MIRDAVTMESRTPTTPCRAASSGSTHPCSRNTSSSSPTAAARRSACRSSIPGASNPFPWMSEVLDLKKEKNFFETRVTEYQTGGALNWD